MKYSEQPLQTFRLRNFKAVRDSGNVKFTPLTVFIGNNGSGKSSLIEGLETFQAIVTDGLDEAMNKWRGFENVLNKSVRHNYQYPKEGRPYLTNPLEFRVRGNNVMVDDFYNAGYSIHMAVTAGLGFDEVFVSKEDARLNGKRNAHFERVSAELAKFDLGEDRLYALTPLRNSNDSMWSAYRGSFIGDWQFLNLDPNEMGQPRSQKRTGHTVKLESNGSNIGDYLLDMIRLEGGTEALDGIIETLRYVLPYAKDVQPTVTTQIQRTVYLQLAEQHFQVPGWLLSTGTLRVLALLAVLRHPQPPPLLCIEEIENGLDPRTLNLIVEEIARATQSGRTQVVCTTHSPYFLDLVPLSSIVVVERDDSGQPTFTRPDEKALGEWATKFAPGQLYTMSQLTRS